MPADSSFVHLHVHTDYSLLDGACKIDRLMSVAKEAGMNALAMTDHGNMFGAIQFYNAAKANDIKPLIGCEVYLVPGSRLEKAGRSEDGKSFYHMGLLAKNLTGYQNLLKLVSDAHLKGFYYKPRTDIETLAKYADGLIGFTGCLAAIVPQHLLNGRDEDARTACARFVDIFGRENFFVEIQDHGIPEQLRIIPGLLKLAEEFNLTVICTNDVHYVKAEDAGPHDALLCIQTGAKIADENRFKFSGTQFYLKTRAEMDKLFHEYPESVTNTQLVAEMCDLKIPFPKGSERYPKYPLPIEVKTDNTGYLLDLCKTGLTTRYGISYDEVAKRDHVYTKLEKLQVAAGEKPKPPDYSGLDQHEELIVRLGYEMAIIQVTGFIDYFLVVWDFINWARDQQIPVGPGRGSGAGCLVAYCLGITNLDPLRFKLLFERFLNPERISPPDFDIDFCMRRRGEVIDYVRDKYGRDCVANIITYGTLGAKSVIRDVARVNDMEFGDADRLAKMIPDELNITLEDALTKSEELRKELDRNPTAKRIFESARVLEGMVRNTGKHAAGIIITDRPLDEFVPLTSQEGDVTVQFSMKAVDKLGLLKMDFLGLKTLTVIADAVQNVRRSADPKFDIDAISLEDEATFALLNTGRTTGVFQLESPGMQNLCRQLQVSSIDEIIALIALYRPGPMDWIPDYIRGKKDPTTVTYPHALLENVCRETYGIMVYQEQVMEAAKVIAGYTLGGADMLRRAMGKKDVDAMAREREKFVAGAKELHNIDSKTSNSIFDILNKFAGYGFNKSHSAAYAILSYQTAYLKANYPVQFMAAVLSSELGNAEKVSHFVDECIGMGIEVLGPDVNESRDDFTPVIPKTKPVGPALTAEGKMVPGGGSIRFGLAGIKGVGGAASLRIIEEREANGPYENFDDFVERVDSKSANKRVLEHLVKTGAFDFSHEPRKLIFERVDNAIATAAANARDRAAGQESFLDMLGDTGLNAPAVPAKRDLKSEISNARSLEVGDFSPAERLAFEKALMGFYVSGHPMNHYRGLAEALNTYPVDHILEMGHQTNFRLCGIASNIVKKLSKRDNRPWAAFTLATRDSSIALNLFADGFAEYGEQLVENAPIAVQGIVLDGTEGPRINLKELYALDGFITSYIKRVTWVVRPDHPEAPGFLEELRTTIQDQSGSVSVEIGILLSDNRVAVAEVSSALKWKLSAQYFQQLRMHPAVAAVQVEAKGLEIKETRRWAKRSG